MITRPTAAEDFASKVCRIYTTILADPPWRFKNRYSKASPEYKKLFRYPTLSLNELKNIPVNKAANANSHLYLWVPNALIPEGLELMKTWGFQYKTNLIWLKIRKDGGHNKGGMGFYFRNNTEVLLFGVRGKLRTLKPGRTQINIISAQKTIHSRKPAEQYKIIEHCSPGDYLELFARQYMEGWDQWGNEVFK